MTFHRISLSLCVTTAALLGGGCARHKSDLASSDPFLDSKAPASQVAENSRTGVLQSGKTDRSTAVAHETINRSSRGFQENGVPGDATASLREPHSRTAAREPSPANRTFAGKPEEIASRPGTKPLTRTAFAPNAAPDFEDEPELVRGGRTSPKPFAEKKPEVELVASSSAEEREAAPFPSSAFDDEPAATPAASHGAKTAKASNSSTRTAHDNPFEDLDAEPAPEVNTAAKSKGTTESASGFEEAGETADAGDPFAESPFPSAATEKEPQTAESSPFDAFEASRTVAQKPAPERHDDPADDENDQFAALRQAGHRKATSAPKPAPAAAPHADANPFADLEADEQAANPPARPAARATAPPAAAKAAEEFFTKAATGSKKTLAAAEPAFEEEPQPARRTRMKAAPAPQESEPADEMSPFVRDVGSAFSPPSEEPEQPAEEEETEGRVRLDDTITPTSYTFEARPPKKAAAPAEGAVQPNGWKPRPGDKKTTP